MSVKRQPTKVYYRYTVDEEARLNPTHGVWGGITPQGEIELNFYYECDAPPLESECTVAPDGTLGPEQVSETYFEQRHITRHIHSRILMNYDTARAVLEWLDDRVTTLEMEEGSLSALPTPSGREQ